MENLKPMDAAQTLCEKISREYPSQLKTFKPNNRQGVIVYNALLSQDSAVKRANCDENSVKEAAFHLRTIIMEMQRTQQDLPHPITTDALISGQGNKPNELLDFFRVLYAGSSQPSPYDRIERLVRSVSDDVIFTTTRGRTKPSKHLCMGLGIKSMTGSRKLLEIINRFGHAISYHTVEALETELATDIYDR